MCFLMICCFKSSKKTKVCGTGKREPTSNETNIFQNYFFMWLMESREFLIAKLGCSIGKLLNSFVNHFLTLQVGGLIPETIS